MSTPLVPFAPLDVFVSYAAADQALRDELAAHLANLEQQGKIRPFDQWKVGPGKDTGAEVAKKFAEAKVILLLVSPEFIASDYCYDVEVKEAMRRHACGEARVVPILVRACDWMGAPFEKLRALPRSGQAVTSWESRDEAWLDVVVGIRSVLEELSWEERPRPGAGFAGEELDLFPTRSGALRNPYDPWNPAVSPNFCGRKALLRDVTGAIGEMRSVSLVGDFRIGKSSLLKECERWAQGSGRVVRWVSGEEASGQSPGAFVKAITGLDSPDGADGAAEVLGRWAEAKGLPSLPPLVLVDEIDGMVSRFDCRFFERLRGLLGGHRLVMAVASCKDLDDLYADANKTSPFFNIVERQQVGLLEPEAAEELIGWGRSVVEEEGRDMLRQWCGRHPFYLQLLGGYLARARMRGEGRDGALDRFQREAESRVKALWRSLEERERKQIKECVDGGLAPTRKGLRWRGVVTEEGKVFGEVLAAWVREEA